MPQFGTRKSLTFPRLFVPHWASQFPRSGGPCNPGLCNRGLCNRGALQPGTILPRPCKRASAPRRPRAPRCFPASAGVAAAGVTTCRRKRQLRPRLAPRRCVTASPHRVMASSRHTSSRHCISSPHHRTCTRAAAPRPRKPRLPPARTDPADNPAGCCIREVNSHT